MSHIVPQLSNCEMLVFHHPFKEIGRKEFISSRSDAADPLIQPNWTLSILIDNDCHNIKDPLQLVFQNDLFEKFKVVKAEII